MTDRLYALCFLAVPVALVLMTAFAVRHDCRATQLPVALPRVVKFHEHIYTPKAFFHKANCSSPIDTSACAPLDPKGFDDLIIFDSMDHPTVLEST